MKALILLAFILFCFTAVARDIFRGVKTAIKAGVAEYKKNRGESARQ